MTAQYSAQPLKEVPRWHVVGRKNSGKTTLVCELVTRLTDQGLKVATIKHTHHQHELDTPGKDSHKHRESGAAGVGILSAQMTAAFVPMEREEDEDLRYARFNVMFNDCDIILVEGDLHTSARRIEVWRSANNPLPYALEYPAIDLLITDDTPPKVLPEGCTVLPRGDLTELAETLARSTDKSA